MNCWARHARERVRHAAWEKSVWAAAGAARVRTPMTNAAAKSQWPHLRHARCPLTTRLRRCGPSGVGLMPQLQHQQDPETVAKKVRSVVAMPGEQLFDEAAVQVAALHGR